MFNFISWMYVTVCISGWMDGRDGRIAVFRHKWFLNSEGSVSLLQVTLTRFGDIDKCLEFLLDSEEGLERGQWKSLPGRGELFPFKQSLQGCWTVSVSYIN